MWTFRAISQSKERLLMQIENEHARSSVGACAAFPRDAADAVKAAVIAFPIIGGYLDVETFGHIDPSGVGNMTIRIQTLAVGTVL